MSAKHATPLQTLLVDKDFDGEVFAHEPMSKHTSYRIGGPARFFVRVDSISALTHLTQICDREGIEWMVVGRGTNLLVSDEGFDGVIITLGRDFRKHTIDAETGIIVAGAGVALSAVVQDAFRSSVAGLEFAVGTPGSIGGAIRMNAGSRDEWIGSLVRDVTTFSPSRGLIKRPRSDIEWGYRHTSLDADETVLECALNVEIVDPFFIRGKMEANLAKRKKTQPLNMPSCGSVFKNPEGASAAKMIDDLGLKGTTIGGAQISEKHANFIVNTGDATAADVCELMQLVKTGVQRAYGIELKPEVRLVGFE